MALEIERKWLIDGLDRLPEELCRAMEEDKLPHKTLIQGYLCISPVVRVRQEGEQYYLTYKNKMTYKNKSTGLLQDNKTEREAHIDDPDHAVHADLVRTEYNLPLTKEAFDHLIQKSDGIILKKERYEIPCPESGDRYLRREAEDTSAHVSETVRTAGSLQKAKETIASGSEEQKQNGTMTVIELDVFAAPYEGLIYAEVEFTSKEKALLFEAPSWFGREVTGEDGYSNAALSQRPQHLPDAR